MIESLVTLLEYHDWDHISLIIQNVTKWQIIAEEFENRARNRHTFKLTLRHRIVFDDNRLCCALRQHCYVAWAREILKTTDTSSKSMFYIQF